MARRNREGAGIHKNDWAFHIAGDGERPALDEQLDDATAAEETAFQERMRQYVSDPKTDACRQEGNRGERVGAVTWVGGPLGMRSWGLYNCKACGEVHGRLEIMA